MVEREENAGQPVAEAPGPARDELEGRVRERTAALEAELAECRRVAAELREGEHRYRNLVDSVEDSIHVKDAQGRYTIVNQAMMRWLGSPREDILGKTALELYPGGGGRKVMEDDWRVLRTGAIIDTEDELPSPRGLRVVHTRKVPLRDAAGAVMGMVTISRDITERKRDQEALRQARDELETRVAERTAELQASNQELEAFAYSVSHDLRAPLRAIDGFSRMLLQDFAPELPAGAQRYLQIVRSSAQQMGHLIDDLLAFSRLNRQSLRLQSVAPADLVRQTIDDLRADLAGRPVEVVLGELPPCRADPALLRQVFANLLSNAFKFTRQCERARVEIGGRSEGDEHVYFVQDNGVGFSMRYAHKLFGVFSRLHRAEDYAGTGVGLAIVQRIIHRHGGRVWAEAEVNRGATFYFTIPKRDE